MKVKNLFEGKGFQQGDEVELIKDFESFGKKIEKGKKGTVVNTNRKKVIVKDLGSIPAEYLKLAEEIIVENKDNLQLQNLEKELDKLTAAKCSNVKDEKERIKKVEILEVKIQKLKDKMEFLHIKYKRK